MRRVCFFVAVGSMLLLAVASIVNSVSFHYRDNWTFITPYTTVPAQPSNADLFFDWSNLALKFLFPLSVLSATGYLIALERELRNTNNGRGFSVKTVDDE